MATVKILCALIASGMSKRFGGNKLEALIGVRMLGTFAAQSLLDAQIGGCIAVTRTQTFALNWWLIASGYRLITNDNPEAGLSHSIALAAHAAVNCGADGLLICLADMPLVPVDSFRALAQAFEHDSLVSTDGFVRMPPAIFPRTSFVELMMLSGDTGARSLLAAATPFSIAPEWLIDIDTRDDLLQHSNSLSKR